MWWFVTYRLGTNLKSLNLGPSKPKNLFQNQIQGSLIIIDLQCLDWKKFPILLLLGIPQYTLYYIFSKNIEQLMHDHEAKITEKVCHDNSSRIQITEKGGRPLITPPHQGPRASASSDSKRQLNATFRG